MPYIKSNKPPGVTFVELVIVMVMISILSLAIYSTLNNGLRVWQKARQQTVDEDINIFLDKMTQDISNTFKFKDIQFSGAPDGFQLATIVRSQKMGQAVGKVVYAYNDSAKMLTRQVYDYSDAYRLDTGVLSGELGSIVDLRFYYYAFDKEKNEYLWQEEWSDDKLPQAVKLHVELGASGKEKKEIEKIVSIMAQG